MKKHVTLFSSVLMMSTTLLGAGGVFADVSQPSTPTPNEVKTPITAELTVNQTPDKPNPPIDPEGGTDKPTEIEGLFGIAYAPEALSGQGRLADSGETSVELSSNKVNSTNKHNVGVQDKTRGKDRNWSLKAQLEWDNDPNNYMAGATVTATGCNVKLNDGEGNLSVVPEDAVTIGDSGENLTISKDSQVEIMKANLGKSVNGVYNYQFQNPKLVIQNSDKVPANTYSGNIIWNLSNAAQ
ncbi:WxL domain-containing protein [Enterococcus faecium]|nr:WxL domain-containing protein [Enterococcus faecium]